MKKFIKLVLVLILFTALIQPSNAYSVDNDITSNNSIINLKLDERKLWIDHVSWTRNFIVSDFVQSESLERLKSINTIISEVATITTHGDLKKALSASQKAEDLWRDITPNARWDWIRWIRAVKTPETRQKHIEVALSKLNKGMRRPCCFNRNLCSEPYVSHNWVLSEPS